jgi:hypothetical protein
MIHWVFQGKMGSSSVARLRSTTEKYKLVLSLLQQSSSLLPAPLVDADEFDFTPWLADLLPPMRLLVWSLVLKVFPHFLEMNECTEEFSTALGRANSLPIETLKQIEVPALPPSV